MATLKLKLDLTKYKNKSLDEIEEKAFKHCSEEEKKGLYKELEEKTTNPFLYYINKYVQDKVGIDNCEKCKKCDKNCELKHIEPNDISNNKDYVFIDLNNNYFEYIKSTKTHDKFSEIEVFEFIFLKYEYKLLEFSEISEKNLDNRKKTITLYPKSPHKIEDEFEIKFNVIEATQILNHKNRKGKINISFSYIKNTNYDSTREAITFRNVIFDNEINAMFTIWNYNIDFTSARFNKDVNFNYSNFLGKRTEKIIDFTKAVFQNATLSLKYCNFINLDNNSEMNEYSTILFNRTEFRNMVIYFNESGLKYCKIKLFFCILQNVKISFYRVGCNLKLKNEKKDLSNILVLDYLDLSNTDLIFQYSKFDTIKFVSCQIKNNINLFCSELNRLYFDKSYIDSTIKIKRSVPKFNKDGYSIPQTNLIDEKETDPEDVKDLKENLLFEVLLFNETTIAGYLDWVWITSAEKNNSKAVNEGIYVKKYFKAIKKGIYEKTKFKDNKKSTYEKINFKAIKKGIYEKNYFEKQEDGFIKEYKEENFIKDFGKIEDFEEFEEADCFKKDTVEIKNYREQLRILKYNAIKIGDEFGYEKISREYYKVLGESSSNTFLRRLAYRFFGITGGYGTKPVNIAVSAVVTIFLFAVIYLLTFSVFKQSGVVVIAGSDDTNIINMIIDYFYFSGATFLTIGYGDLTPAHWFIKISTIIEGLIGVVLTSYLGASLFRKFIK